MARAWRPAAAAFRQGAVGTAIAKLVDGMWGQPGLSKLFPERVQTALRNARAMRVLTDAKDPFPTMAPEAIGTLRMPVLLLRGERTSALHRLVVDELARALRVAELVIVRGAGHAAPVENSLCFNSALLGFLARQAGETRWREATARLQRTSGTGRGGLKTA
jgi:pimeloyl-ACP methyl ester carboxylesterase